MTELNVTNSSSSTKVSPADSTLPVIFVHGDFDNDMAHAFIDRLHYLEEDDNVEEILISIDSFGGSVYSLLSMIDAIKSSNKIIHTSVIGMAASAASVLFAIGKERWISPNSTVLIHQVSCWAAGTTAIVTTTADEMKRLQDITFTILADACGRTKDHFDEMVKNHAGADIYLSPQQCLSMSLATKIGFPRVVPRLGWYIK
jgi:ATP-dependent Clp endopeptidase proteolytic subunit ClpP